MFWKIGTEKAQSGARRLPGRPWSLALRLTVWYAASSLLLLAATSGFMYWALLNRFDREDDIHLRSKLYEMRQWMAIRRSTQGALRVLPPPTADADYPERTVTRILSRDGALVAETEGMDQALPQAAFKDVPLNGGGRGVKGPSGMPFRAIVADVVIAAPAEHYVVQLAVDRRLESRLIAQYRQWLWTIFIFAVPGCTAVGYWIARRGLRAVREMAAVVRGVRPATLNQRIDAERFPRELGGLADSFNEMMRELEDAFARLSRYSSDIAHELRTPVHNLRGEAEVALGRARSPEEYREALGSCLEECVRLSSLIDRLLFLARSENPQTQIRRERLNINSELAALREFYSAVAAEAGLSLELEAEAGISADIDRQLFQQAVGNLVENAIAYSSRGAVRIAAKAEDGMLLVEVQDSGRGIPPEHLPHVFDRFYRVDATRCKQTGGLGLGLAIVKTIAALHGGSVGIASTLGVGTRVSLRLPIQNSAAT